LREATADPAPLRWGGRHLGRAAILVLLTAGAAAALPWSPVRNLLSPRSSATTEESAVATGAEEAPTAASSDQPAGIAVALEDGSVHVVVRGAAPGSELSMVWTDQSSARLTAPPGSRFTYASGRVEVDASRGAVLIELPRSASAVSLDVDGQPYLRGSPSALDVPGPVVEQTDETIRFRVDDR
jgi:hypothetical protein